MAERRTKEVLLRLRHAKELELRRELVLRRAARAEARRVSSAAEAERRDLERDLATTTGRRTVVLERPRAAGRLARAEQFERALRDEVGKARARERAAASRLDAAESALAATQRSLAEAVHARQRSESLAATEKASAARATSRREQAEVEDRYRVPVRRPRLK